MNKIGMMIASCLAFNIAPVALAEPEAFLLQEQKPRADKAAADNKAKTFVLEDCDAGPAFSFKQGGKVNLLVQFAAGEWDFDLALDFPHGLLANNKKASPLYNGSGGLRDMGAVALDDVKEAPADGYVPKLELKQLMVGHTYCVRTSDGKHYGKFHILKADMKKELIEFSWEYQPQQKNGFESKKSTK